MGGKKVTWVIAVVLMCRAGAVFGAGLACVADSPRSMAVTTGAAIDVRQEQSGKVVVELKSKEASVRREFARGSSTTVLSGGGHQLTIRLTSSGIRVSDGKKTMSGDVGHKDSLQTPVTYLRQSPIVRAARTLLDGAALNADTFEGNALLLTRALLASVAGDSTPTVEYQAWAASKIKEPRVVRAQAKGPGQCWDLYASEAMRIINDYIDCANSCNWAGWFCMGGCGFLYDIRAEAAFMWFIDCSGGFFVAG
jgi:hypothetical protein